MMLGHKLPFTSKADASSTYRYKIVKMQLKRHTNYFTSYRVSGISLHAPLRPKHSFYTYLTV